MNDGFERGYKKIEGKEKEQEKNIRPTVTESAGEKDSEECVIDGGKGEEDFSNHVGRRGRGDGCRHGTFCDEQRYIREQGSL